MKAKELTQADLKNLLSYDPLTGVFKWNVNRRKARKGMIAGCIDSCGYIQISILQGSYRAHRLAWLYMHGYMPPLIDHIDGVKTNNSLGNLRIANITENSYNSARRNDNTSGVKGVSKNKARGTWQARCRVGGISHFIGEFKSIERAEAELRKFREEYQGEFFNHGT